MFAIVYKQDRVPMCARVRAEGPDAVVFWSSESRARQFLLEKGDDFGASYDVVRIDDDGLHKIALALGCSDEQIELVPFPE